MKKLICALLGHKWQKVISSKFFGSNKLYECDRCHSRKSIVFGKEKVL